MNVIVFASRKGGSGKSTLAAHIAAHVHKATKPCLLIDADPQGSLTLWHKLRGTNEPAIRPLSIPSADRRRREARWNRMGIHRYAAEHVGRRGGCHQERHDGDYSGAAGVFDVNAVQETILTCRAARKPYAVVINARLPAETRRRAPSSPSHVKR